MAQQHTNQRQRGNAALQQVALSTLPLQSSLQVSRKLDCTKPPIKDAQPALPGSAQETNAAAHTNAARKHTGAKLSGVTNEVDTGDKPGETGDNLSGVTNQVETGDTNVTHKSRGTGANVTRQSRVTRACVTLKQAEKITCLTPSHGTERLPIAPPHGVESPCTAPCGGAIRGCFDYLSTPPHGDHLEKPSVPGFKPSTSKKFSASHHPDSRTTLKGKQPILFTGGAASCYIANKPRGPVLDTPKNQRLQPPPESGVSSRPNFGDRCALSYRPSWLRGWERIPVRIAARLVSCVYPHLHPHCLDSMRVVSLIQPGIQTMTAITQQASRAATSTTGTPDPIQLHADAHNALNMAVFYLRQPDANVAGARRKAIQALTALRGLSLALEG